MAKKPLHESHIRSLRFMFSRSLAAPTTAMHLPPVAIPPHYTEQAMPAALFDETHLLDLAPAPHPVLPDAGQYRLKFVHLAKRDTSIILQNENGPCPLLAIANLLLVCGKLTVHADLAWITHSEVTSLVTDYLMANKPKLSTPEEVANYEQNVHDAVMLMPSLHRGLDVNVKFVGTDKFEFTQELLIFDLLGIQLRHGWVVDPDDKAAYRLLAKMSYNELMERLVQYHALVAGDQHTIKGIAEADRGRIMEEGAILQRWHDETSHQLTWTGLAELHRTLSEGLPVVFFRNNHFSTLVLKGGHLYCLTTDQGYLRQGRIVWERLTEIEGDVLYVDGEWIPYTPPKEGDLVSGATSSNPSLPVVAAMPDTHDQDAALARQLQDEERHKAQQREDDWRRQEEARRLDKQRRRREDDCALM